MSPLSLTFRLKSRIFFSWFFRCNAKKCFVQTTMTNFKPCFWNDSYFWEIVSTWNTLDLNVILYQSQHELLCTDKKHWQNYIDTHSRSLHTPYCLIIWSQQVYLHLCCTNLCVTDISFLSIKRRKKNPDRRLTTEIKVKPVSLPFCTM